MINYIYEDTLFGNQIIGISKGKIKLIECDNRIVDKMVEKYHYSHKATKNRFKSFLINDGLGFIQLGYGIRPYIKSKISKLITHDNYCEFDRMWLSDELPKFSESQAIGLLIRYLKLKYKRIKFIITYADGSMGNTGIIYQATNAIKIGKVNVDFYILTNGERIHPVSMYHRHKTRAWSVINKLYPGIKHITDEFQYRYLYILDKKILRQFLINKTHRGFKERY